jgi:thiol-disulfide isomerase/thioredoxin
MLVSCGGGSDTALNADTTDVPSRVESQAGPVIAWRDCSGKMNDHPCDFTLADQNGMPWRLYDHVGDIIVLDISTIWCGVCQHAGTKTQQYHDMYKDKGVIWVTVILENYFGRQPTLDDIKEWAMVFSISDAPVLVGNLGLLDPLSLAGWYINSLPLFVVIDRSMTTVYRLDGYNEQIIQLWVEELLANE